MTKALSTRDLLRGEHHLHLVGHKPGRRWVWLVLLLLASIGLAAYLRLQQEADLQDQLSQLSRENTELKASLAQLRMQQREAEAAQAQLVRRNGDLAAQVKKLKTDLTFFRQQQDR